MEYLSWNDSIAAHFFSTENAGRRVHLFITKEQIAALGQPVEAGVEDFIEACKTGPPWATKQGLCRRAYETFSGWRDRDLNDPPYLAYLALFVVAASLEGDFAAHAYYPRLRKLLGEPETGRSYPRFEKMLELWDDLERWSSVDKDGELGVFRNHLYGGWINVGLPVAQTLLTESDRYALPTLFAQAGFDPAAPPAERSLASTLLRQGQGYLGSRTLHLLRDSRSASQDSASSAGALIEIVLSELRDWDGAFEAIANAGDDGMDGETLLSGTLRLCGLLDRIAGQTRFTLRCTTAREFPDEGFILSFPEDASEEDEYVCEECGNGWSSPLEERASGKSVDATSWDWRAGAVLEDREQGWTFRWRGAPLRLLVDGQSAGLAGYVEVFRLPTGAPFYLLSHEDVAEEIAAWGQSACDGWQELNITRGLPAGWRMFQAQRARDDTAVRDKFPLLSLPSSVSLRLFGGVRVGRGNRYFAFAPPSIEVQGAGEIEVLCNGEPLSPGAQGLYELPEHIAPLEDDEDKVEVAVHCNGQQTGRAAFYLAHEGWDWAGFTPACWFDEFGKAISDSDNENGTAGALVASGDEPPFDFAGVVPVLDEGAVHFIGRQPGEIAHWPQEPRPIHWKPVWMIVTRRGRGEAEFCGLDIAAAKPLRGTCRDRREVKKWREVLWVDRKKIAPPSNRVLRALWKQYQEMAKNV